MKKSTYIIISVVIIAIVVLVLWNRNQFDLPQGETVPLELTDSESSPTSPASPSEAERANGTSTNNVEKANTMRKSEREIFVTDDVKHSIPLNEILSGGPPKDGIPSIDNPKFISVSEADFLDDSDVGLGIILNGVSKFYPYQILVWHEIVNDNDVLVTYCPLCATGIAFDPHVDGQSFEFGVSGKLWQSNLLMYNRTGDDDTESLWSQVLGEAVLGPATGIKLVIIPADTVLYGDWKEKHTDTLVLSRKTGAARTYGLDPYGDYYTNETVGFGATFTDDRLHPKAFVLGIEINGQYKAYPNDTLPEGTTTDTFASKIITIEKDDIGGVRMFIGSDKRPLSYIGGFWFSWVAVHPDSELFN